MRRNPEVVQVSALSERLREAALNYASLGFKVFPLQAQGKKKRARGRTG